ncbi:MAG: outer membrane beta-barrel protein [Acidobacteriota bacterium]
MTHRTLRILAVTALALFMVRPARAQQPSAWTGAGFIAIDAGYQIASTTFDTTTTYTLNVEPAHVSASYEIEPGPMFGARGGVRVWKNLAVGAGVSYFSQTGHAEVEAQLPHPFYLNRNRMASGTLGSFEHQQVMVSAEASWLVRAGSRVNVTIFGGPAYFRAWQTVAGAARFTESYPYDEAMLTDVERTSQTISATGFTVGADVSYLFSKAAGVGGLLRYSRASGRLGGGETAQAALDLGGVQASGGLRIRF